MAGDCRGREARAGRDRGEAIAEESQEDTESTMANALQIESRREGADSGVLSLRGEVDVANSQQVRDAALALIGTGIKRLVIDLSSTDYLDSAGLGILVGLLKRARESDLTLVVAGAQPRVQRLFDITKLNQVFTMRQDVTSALQEVAR